LPKTIIDSNFSKKRIAIDRVVKFIKNRLKR
jgi:hypothetical protein